MKKLRTDDHGFTLLEVILSMAILALISVPLMKYFSDSLRHTALMAQRQKATLLAQESIESMKSQEKLIRQVLEEDGTHGYWIPSLAGTNHSYTPAAGEKIFQKVDIPGKSFDTTTGKGTIRLVKRGYEFGGLEYDVAIDLSTELLANDQGQAVVHGIDDRKNALIVERDQEQDALAYFLSVNATYKMGTFVGAGATPAPDPGDTPAPAPDPGDAPASTPDPDSVHLFDTVEELRPHVRREIWIEIGGVQVDLPGGGGSKNYYTVKAYYKYFCKDINDQDEVPFQPGNIYESQMDGLDSVYLLFNIFDPVEDVIHVEANDSSSYVAAGKAPAIILVCQNMDALLNGAEEGAPAPGVTFTEEEYKPKLILNEKYSTWAGDSLLIRTNIIVNNAEEGGGGGPKGAILKADGNPYNSANIENMDAVSTDSVRVVSIDISVFKAGEYKDDGTGTPLVQMKTTKSE